MNNPKPEKLLPCPFCEANTAAVVPTGIKGKDYMGVCLFCGSQGKKQTNEESAIKAWNTRSQVKTLDENAVTNIILDWQFELKQNPCGGHAPAMLLAGKICNLTLSKALDVKETAMQLYNNQPECFQAITKERRAEASYDIAKIICNQVRNT